MTTRYPRVQLWDRACNPTYRHPAGLSGAPCPERHTMAQGNPVGRPPRQAMCRYCGRVTSRVDTEGMAWCGGKVRNE